MNTATAHVTECAYEMGIDFPPAISCEEDFLYRGHLIETFYYEDRCCWAAFCQGFGERTSWEDRLIALNRMTSLIDKESAQ